MCKAVFAGAIMAGAVAARGQQVIVENADPFNNVDIGTIRAQNFYDNFAIRAKVDSFSPKSYVVAAGPSMFGNGLIPLNSPVSLGQNYQDVTLKGDPNSVRPENDPTDYTQSFGLTFTPDDNTVSSYATVTAHVVSAALQFDGTAAVQGLSKRTIGFGETVTLPIGVTNSSHAVAPGGQADLTVSHDLYGNAYRPTDFIENDEVTIISPAGNDPNASTALAPGQSLGGYSVKIAPLSSNGPGERYAFFGAKTDFDGPQGYPTGGRSFGFSYFAPTTVAPGAAQTATGLGGAGQVGGITATLPATTGGDFAVDFSEQPASSLPGTPNFEIAGSLAQQWDITYTDAAGNPVLLGAQGAELTFHFDRSLLPPGFDPDTLQIEHYDGTMYELLPVVARGTDTITVLTTSFSPFVLATSSAVPEPASLSVAVLATGLLLGRRNRRTPRH